MMPERTRLIFAIVAFALGAGMALAPTGPEDFAMFWYVGRHWAEAYNPTVSHSPGFTAIAPPTGNLELPFFYPPTFLPVVALFGLAPLAVAKVLWSGVWTAAFAWTASRDTRWATPLLALSLPLLWCAAIAQTGLMIATLVIAGFQLRQTRPALAGALLAAAACIKPQALLLAPIVLWGEWRLVRAAIATAAAAALVSLAFGPRLWLDWIHILPRFGDLVAPTVPHVAPAYVFGALWWRVGVGLVGIAFALFDRSLTGLLVGTLMCTPYVQLYDLAGLSYIGARFVADARRASAAKVVFGAILTVCVAWPVLTAAYCAALIGLSVARVWRRQPEAQTQVA
jgi:hypothetical protein